MLIVGMTGFEPAASSSRTKRATGLRYIPKMNRKIILICLIKQYKFPIVRSIKKPSLPMVFLYVYHALIIFEINPAKYFTVRTNWLT